MSEPLKIACLCPTYGRPQLVRNALACFLQQVYVPGRAKLFILDDAGQIENQNGDHFLVESTAVRYASMGAKFARFVSLADRWGAEAYAVWNDDDLYLPWHLSAADWAIRQGFCWSYPQWVMSDERGQLLPEMTSGNFHGSIVVGKEILQQVGGWPDTPRADFDLQLISSLLRADEPGRPDYQFAPSYVFRSECIFRSEGGLGQQPCMEKIEGKLTPILDRHATWLKNVVIPQLEDLRCAMPPRKVRLQPAEAEREEAAAS